MTGHTTDSPWRRGKGAYEGENSVYGVDRDSGQKQLVAKVFGFDPEQVALNVALISATQDMHTELTAAADALEEASEALINIDQDNPLIDALGDRADRIRAVITKATGAAP